MEFKVRLEMVSGYVTFFTSKKISITNKGLLIMIKGEQIFFERDEVFNIRVDDEQISEWPRDSYSTKK